MTNNAGNKSIEIWGGIECTVNRIGNSYMDQCELNLHWRNIRDDLVLFKEMGLNQIRYPALWEKMAPTSLANADFSPLDQAMNCFSELKMTPILGLLHHGSGPLCTNLADDRFPAFFANYAQTIAERYPWVTYYTPINEPLTTARFSGLYGHWYPHAQSEPFFLRILVNQIKATLLAFKEIKKINKQAKILQTEDLGKAHSTEILEYQRDFENERRWLSLDLLSGHVKKDHFFYQRLIKMGIHEKELDWLQENGIEIDLIGLNHYPLSNRFLDHEIENYPPSLVGGNSRARYVDIGAYSRKDVIQIEPKEIFREAWTRYQRPLVISEVHIHAGREAQLRWIEKIMSTCEDLIKENQADIRAITIWSLLGSYDWNSLCTRRDLFYESGAFDISAGIRRPTAIKNWIVKNTHNRRFTHPTSKIVSPRPIVITGGNGTLGRAFARVCEKRDLCYRLLTRQQLDIADPKKLSEVMTELKPWALINAAGYVKVDDAEKEVERCLRENLAGPTLLAKTCRDQQIQLLSFSSDLVFDGNQSDPYCENHAVGPLNVYGTSKAEAEREILKVNPLALVIRTSAFFSPWEDYNFPSRMLKLLRRGEKVKAASDVIVSPTYLPDLTEASLDLLMDEESGLVNLANVGQVSWAEWAKRLAQVFSIDPGHVEGCLVEDLLFAAKRPSFSALKSERVNLMPDFESAFDRYVRAMSC